MEIQAFIIFILFQSTLSLTNVFHLQGYKILAEPLGDAKDFDDHLDCAVECVDTGSSCIGYKYQNGECQFLTQIRNIIADYESCFYYVIDRIDANSGNPKMTGLNKTEQLVISNAYGNSTCPQKFSFNTTACTMKMDEATCNEYTNSFNATFNGSACVIPVSRSEWYCVSTQKEPKKKLFSTPFQGFCYFKVPTPKTKSLAEFNQQCQSTSTKSALLSICSTAENDFVASFATEWPTMLSLYNPAADATFGIYNWTDASIGGYCAYRKWHALNSTTIFEDEPNDYKNNTETIVGMKDDQYWYDYPVVSITAKTIICQEKAISLADYMTQCETLDKCKQLK